jgi:NitT/TauT family transport system substrate-binding protein
MKIARYFAAVLVLLIPTMGVSAADHVTMMFPASPDLPNVSAFQIAKYRHYYSDAGLDVEFLAGKGGVDAGRQAGAGKADFAEVFGDTEIILRSEGLPLKIVALMGGRSPMVLAARAESGIRSVRDLKGKSISILGYQDSTYYVLLAALATANLGKEDVHIQARGASGVIQDFISGNVQVCACIPDWIVAAEEAGVKMNLIPISDTVPALGQSIVTSDGFLAAHPDIVRRFVQATLKAYSELRDDPDETAKDYIRAVPVHQEQEQTLRRVYGYYGRFAWTDQKTPGEVDSGRLKELQDVYYNQKLIAKKSPLDRLFTNRFVGVGRAPGGVE